METCRIGAKPVSLPQKYGQLAKALVRKVLERPERTCLIGKAENVGLGGQVNVAGYDLHG